MYVRKHIPKRVPIKLELGKHYTVRFMYGTKTLCKFIQVTKCGFNFVSLESDKCILRRHLYRSKCDNHKKENWFFVNETFQIIRIK